ncbi:MAG: hypothetical protein R3F31_05025 [Verrucomicrobiales bacterium]
MRFLFPSQDWTGRPLGLSEILLPGSSEINPLNDAMDAYAIAMLLVIAFISLSVAALGDTFIGGRITPCRNRNLWTVF